VSMRSFQGQPRGRRRRRLRPLRMMRPATPSSRNRRRLGFPASGGVVVPGQGLCPGQQVGGERDDLEPDLVLGKAVEGQVTQPGVFEATDPVLGASVLPVADSSAAGVQPGPRVLVARQVIREPSWSVSRSCAPGW
jgi:hypothetical protein